MVHFVLMLLLKNSSMLLLKNSSMLLFLQCILRMHCMFCGMPKDTSRAEAMSNSEKIKPVALAVIELHLSEGISQLLTYLLSQ